MASNSAGPSYRTSSFIRIPEGDFLMGSDEGQADEQPVHRVWVDTFALSVYPVTREQFAAFLEATGHDAPRDWANRTRLTPVCPSSA